MPKNVTCEKGPDRLTLTRRWFSAGAVLRIVVSLFWCGAILTVYTVVTLSYVGRVSMGGPRWLLYLILLPFLWFWRRIAYDSMTGVLNKTVIEVTSSQLSVQHRPLPWPGNQSLPVSDLKSLYCKQVVGKDMEGEPWITHSLLAKMEPGYEIELLKEIEWPGTVKYLAEEIEAWLGLEDTAVAEEWSPLPEQTKTVRGLAGIVCFPRRHQAAAAERTRIDVARSRHVTTFVKLDRRLCPAKLGRTRVPVRVAATVHTRFCSCRGARYAARRSDCM